MSQCIECNCFLNQGGGVISTDELWWISSRGRHVDKFVSKRWDPSCTTWYLDMYDQPFSCSTPNENTSCSGAAACAEATCETAAMCELLPLPPRLSQQRSECSSCIEVDLDELERAVSQQDWLYRPLSDRNYHNSEHSVVQCTLNTPQDMRLFYHNLSDVIWCLPHHQTSLPLSN